MAHIYKKGKNSWRVVVELPSIKGERKRVTKTVKGKQKDAELVLAEMQYELKKKNFQYTKPEKIKLADQLEKFLKEIKNHIRQKTYEGYESIVKKHLIPALGHFYITEVTPHVIREYYNYALEEGSIRFNKKGLSPKSIKQHHVILKQAFDLAVEDKALDYNPILSVKPPKIRLKDITILTAEELVKLITYLRETDSSIFIPVYIASVTGARLSEVLGLKWDDVDFKNEYISINKTLHANNNGEIYFDEVKSKNSYRSIQITEEDITVLKQHRKKQLEQKMLLGSAYNDLNMVCAKADGNLMNPYSVSSRFRRVARVLEIKASFHALRHTHATLLFKSGAHQKYVSTRLGHHSTAFTQDVYGHVTPSDDKKLASMFGEILRAK